MKTLLIFLIVMVFQWGAMELCADDKDTAVLKFLVRSKFDSNQDGALEGKEKERALTFLQNVDKDRNNEISDGEQATAIADLKEMPSPKLTKKSKGVPIRPPVIIRRPASTKSTTTGSNNSAKGRAEMRALQQKSGAKSTGDGLPKKKSYYDNATIIGVSDAHTLVPEGSVLYTPPLLVNMIVTLPKGQLMTWPAFRDKYKRFINTLEVTSKMANGRERIRSADKSAFVDNRKIVVAVIQKNPTSVMKPARK